MWLFVDIAQYYREHTRDIVRKNQGFLEKEVPALRAAYDAADKDKSGEIAKREVGVLLEQFFPDCNVSDKSHEAAIHALEVCDEDGDGQLTFNEFLKLMRLLQDDKERRALEKERTAVKETGFTYNEVKEFRQVFGMFRHNDNSGEMSFEEFEAMMANIIPMGDKNAELLHNMLLDNDTDGSLTVDFPEFLTMMKKVKDDDFAGVNEKAAEAADAADPSARLAREEAERKAKEQEELRQAMLEAERIAAEERQKAEEEEARQKAAREFKKSFGGDADASPEKDPNMPSPRTLRQQQRAREEEEKRLEAERIAKAKIAITADAMDGKRYFFEERLSESDVRARAARRAKERADEKARLQAEKLAQELAEKEAKLEAERLAEEEKQRAAQEEAEWKAKVLAERKAKEEEERKQKELEAKEAAKRRAKGVLNSSRAQSMPLLPHAAKGGSKGLYEVRTGIVGMRISPNHDFEAVAALKGGHRFYAKRFQFGKETWLKLHVENVAPPIFSPAGLKLPKDSLKTTSQETTGSNPVASTDQMFAECVPTLALLSHAEIHSCKELWIKYEEDIIYFVRASRKEKGKVEDDEEEAEKPLSAPTWSRAGGASPPHRLPPLNGEKQADNASLKRCKSLVDAVLTSQEWDPRAELVAELRQEAEALRLKRQDPRNARDIPPRGAGAWCNFRKYGVAPVPKPVDTNCGRWRQLCDTSPDGAARRVL
eukprot:gnl/TRDRNA2_/TRDRNA2_85935_c0_seq1.p1 gnl/TRDRNA2_/TRDRNA2_85935_c0~~gnl/TRDRNA2_/TRDRNA2_85935_c0_seq1.p1  ORF type:complete len:813 (+),score=232.40 gnl/TRDRNA2_/TRDRNA2_85935_c0_seq1:299-2440(+)